MSKVGIDEVGRGALAGPLVVGAVCIRGNPDELVAELLLSCKLKVLKDSKKLSALQRERVAEFVTGRVVWGIGEATPAEIDSHGLTEAVRLASGRALAMVASKGCVPSNVLADAGLVHPLDLPTEHIVKGDEKILEITLASIVAKVWRDKYMTAMEDRLPGYGFAKHVGYGTSFHYAAIAEHGITPEHRRLFLKKVLVS
ncbi:MAG: ribonuclease [Patescibacteria group bacterium]|jgi:ribonuclease HII|nr:ribonuclease [Patescibacteria group bacterium]